MTHLIPGQGYPQNKFPEVKLPGYRVFASVIPTALLSWLPAYSPSGRVYACTSTTSEGLIPHTLAQRVLGLKFDCSHSDNGRKESAAHFNWDSSCTRKLACLPRHKPFLLGENCLPCPFIFITRSYSYGFPEILCGLRRETLLVMVPVWLCVPEDKSF